MIWVYTLQLSNTEDQQTCTKYNRPFLAFSGTVHTADGAVSLVPIHSTLIDHTLQQNQLPVCSPHPIIWANRQTIFIWLSAESKHSLGSSLFRPARGREANPSELHNDPTKPPLAP